MEREVLQRLDINNPVTRVPYLLDAEFNKWPMDLLNGILNIFS